jgi:hypothetical protein
MSAQGIALAAGCHLRELPVTVQFEFVAYDGRRPESLPAAPGAAVRIRPDGLVLHFAPQRWLLSGDCAPLRDQLDGAGVDGTLVDVAGKWRLLELTGGGAARLLASGVELDSLLAGRDCAATTFIDCPVIVSRSAGALRLWTPASYREELVARLLALKV